MALADKEKEREKERERKREREREGVKGLQGERYGGMDGVIKESSDRDKARKKRC